MKAARRRRRRKKKKKKKKKKRRRVKDGLASRVANREHSGDASSFGNSEIGLRIVTGCPCRAHGKYIRGLSGGILA